MLHELNLLKQKLAELNASRGSELSKFLLVFVRI
jgi:hypothetical protein